MQNHPQRVFFQPGPLLSENYFTVLYFVFLNFPLICASRLPDLITLRAQALQYCLTSVCVPFGTCWYFWHLLVLFGTFWYLLVFLGTF